MRLRSALTILACLGATALTASAARAQLFSEDFDDAPDVAWNINYGRDTNVTVVGTKNEVPNFSFDYSTVGIPPAPSQDGNSTRGMQLKAALNTGDPTTGVSVSPNVQVGQGASFTGDYRLTFDLWSNFNGGLEGSANVPEADGLWEGGSGSTLFSNYGILSNGLPTGEGTGNYQTGSTIGVAEALFFSNTGDGQNGYDYRVHGPERESGYRGTVEGGHSATLDAGVTFADAYPAGHSQGGEGETNRGVQTAVGAQDPINGQYANDGELYRAAFPSVAAPGQETFFPFQQFGTTMQGALGMAWRQVEIKKVANIVTWSVLNSALEEGVVLLATVDLDVIGPTSGTNIMFGHADGITGQSNDANFEKLQFTLIDNVTVEAIAAPPEDNADFDGDGDVDGADFLTWQRGVGTAGTQPQGNADGEGIIDGADLLIWEGDFGATATAAANPVPEPAAWVMAIAAAIFCLTASLPRRRAALAATTGNII